MKAEELSPKELRIGNFVNYKYFNPHPENPEYCFTKVVIRGVYESSIRISFPKQKHIEKVSKVYSIPLSEDVLLKCPEIQPSTWMPEMWTIRDPKSQFHIVKMKGRFVFRGLGMSVVYVDTLHHLQNLVYTVTGEELEVRL